MQHVIAEQFVAMVNPNFVTTTINHTKLFYIQYIEYVWYM
jgi:hypothetical protein